MASVEPVSDDDMKDSKKACKVCGFEDLQKEVSVAMTRTLQSSQMQHVHTSCGSDMTKISDMLALLSALRNTEFVKKDMDTIAAMKGVFNDFGRVLLTFLDDSKISGTTAEDIMQVPVLDGQG